MFSWLKNQIQGSLIRIGGFFQTDMFYVAKQGGWLSLGQVINYVLGFGATIAFANLLPKDIYGIYRYILSIFGIMLLTSLSDMNTAVTKYVAEGYENIYGPAVKTRIKWGLLGSVLALGTSAYYFWNGNSLFGGAFIVVAGAVPFFDSMNTYLSVMSGKKRFDLQTRYNIITRLISSATIIIALFLSDNLLIILGAYFIPYILIGWLLGKRALKKLDLNNRTNPETIKFGKNLSFIAMIWVGINQLDSIIIFQFLGPVQLAVYSIALAPINRLQSTLGVIPEISIPKFAERPFIEIKATLLKRLGRSLIFTSLIMASYIVAVPYFFRWFFPQYQEAILISQILAIPLLWYPSAFISRILAVKAPVKTQYILNAAESAIQIAVMVLFTYLWGIYGAALGRVIVSSLGSILVYYFFQKLKPEETI